MKERVYMLQKRDTRFSSEVWKNISVQGSDKKAQAVLDSLNTLHRIVEWKVQE